MTAFSAAVIAFLTLTPIDQKQSELKFFSFCILCKPDSVTDALQNIVLFVPFGVALAFRVRSIWIAASIGLAFSLAIELAQFQIPGRYPALQDVLTNATGTVIGWVIMQSRAGSLLRLAFRFVRQIWLRCARPDRMLCGRLALGALALTTIIFSLTGWLLTSRLPDGPPIVSTKRFNSTDLPLRIGTNGDQDGHFKGALDEVRIYRRALSGEEIGIVMRKPVAKLPATLKDGLVAAFEFEEPGGATVSDSSGMRNHGQLAGAVRGLGYFGRGLEFDGSHSEVVVPSVPALKLTDQFTLAAWIRPEVPLGSWPGVIVKGKDDYALYAGGDGALVPNGGARFGVATDSAVAPISIRPERWVHLATTYNGSTVTLYVDGRPLAQLDRWYSGDVRHFEIGSIQLDSRYVPAGILADALISGQAIMLKCVAGPKQSGRGALLDIRNAVAGDSVLWLGAEQSDLILREYTVAKSLGLSSPEFRSVGALANVRPGEPFEVYLFGVGGARKISVNGSIATATGHSVGMGWAIVTESRYLPCWAQQALAAVWIAAWAFPAGFWSRTHLVRAITFLGVGGALLLVPAVTPLTPTPQSQWLGALAGYFAGAIAGRIRPDL